MTIWHLHLLNARQGLTPVMSEIRAAAREAVALASDHADLPDFDLLVRGREGYGSTDMPVGGHAPAPGLIEVTLNPARFSGPALVRRLLHEMHHLIRWDGPGYGNSLGEALVSEGLAGHFVLQVQGGPPDPWDAVRPASGLARQAMNEWARRDVDFPRWFLGKGNIRRWAGYGLGHRLIAQHLAQAPEETAASLAHAPAEGFRPAMRRLVAEEGGAELPADEQDDAVADSPAGDVPGPVDDGSTGGGEAPGAVAGVGPEHPRQEG